MLFENVETERTERGHPESVSFSVISAVSVVEGS